MTKLLVSVRDAAEAMAALSGGADIIDVKEPLRGPLGMADAIQIDQVTGAVAGRVPLSVAMGELVDWNAASDWAMPDEFRFAKIGLSSLGDDSDWNSRWKDWRQNLPSRVRPVAVAYADWSEARAPDPSEVIRAAVDHDGGVLFDTWTKDGRNLFDFLSEIELRRFLRSARKHKLLVALAGSIDSHLLPLALGLRADIVAVRGAACLDGRGGIVVPERVRRLATMIHCPAAAQDQRVSPADGL